MTMTLVLTEDRPWSPAQAPAEEAALGLLRRLAAGEREALGELYDHFADELFGFALWFTGSREEAADVVQEVFVRLLQRPERLARVSRPRAYLLRTARAAAVDRYRRSRRHARGFALEEGLLVAPPTDPSRRLDAARLDRWLRKLPAEQRAAIYLRFYCDLTFAEIGRVQGVPMFTAASRCRLATRRLRRWLAEEAT